MTYVPQYIYFMRPVGQVGPIKIGCSIHPEKRLVQISTWSPIPLEIIATALGNSRLENFVHRKFKAQRLHREWFEPCEALLAGIAAIQGGATVEETFNATKRFRNSRYEQDRLHYVDADEDAGKFMRAELKKRAVAA